MVQGMREHPPDPNHANYRLFQETPMPHHAPDAYRVAMPAVGEAIAKVLHIGNMPWIAAGLDFVFAVATLLSCYAVVVWGNERRTRAVAIGLMLGLVQVPLAWVIPWARPETVPTSFYLVFAVVCLLKVDWRWRVGLLALTVWQGFVRPDVPLAMGLALVLVGMLDGERREFGTRGWTVGTGLAMAGIAVGVQGHLKYGLMPGLTYWPDTPVIMLRENLRMHNWSNWALAFGLFVVLGVGMRRVRLGGIERLLVISASLYLALWATVGILDEVRIGVPMLFGLSVMAARMGAKWLAGDEVPG